MNIVDYYLYKEAGLDPRIMEEIAERLSSVGKTLAKPQVIAPAALATGAAGMYGLEDLGQQRIQAEQQAAQLRQLLKEHPELLDEEAPE